MSLYVDLHILHTVPPSNLNRDDTGNPKTAIYGESGARGSALRPGRKPPAPSTPSIWTSVTWGFAQSGRWNSFASGWWSLTPA